MTTTAPVRPLPLNTIVKVAGVSFRQEAVRQVVELDEVRIRHDQLNEFDANACAVVTLDGVQLGFIPQDLAVRLAVPHPGGVWRAKIEEVLRNETWGLRVKIGPLVTEGRLDAGARAGGLRHRGAGTIEAPNGAVAVTPVTEATAAAGERSAPQGQVYAKSGRHLGRLVAAEGAKVVVHTLNGGTATYPAAVVQVRAA